jgi:hypothetical protein
VSALLFGTLLGWAVGPSAAVRGTLNVSDRTEVRVRDSGLPTDPALDAMNQPGFELELATRRSKWNLGYSARYTLLNLHLELKPTLLNQAYVRAQWSASRRTQLTLTQDGSWGRQSFIGTAVVQTLPSASPQATGAPTAGAAPVPRIDAVPQVLSFSYVYCRPALMSTTALTARWTLDTTVFHVVDGGFDAEARRTLPLMWGPGFEAQATYHLSRRDQLLSTVTAKRTVASSGPETILVTAAEGIQRKIARRTDVRLEVGVAAAWFKPESNARNDLTPYPIATGVLTHRHFIERDAALGFDLTASVAPMIYRLTGYVTQQFQATAAVSLTEKRLTVRMGTGALRTLRSDDPQALRIFFADANVAYAFGKLVSVDTGVRYVWQDMPTVGNVPPQKMVYVGMTIREPTLRF